jgi:hypothetical protein
MRRRARDVGASRPLRRFEPRAGRRWTRDALARFGGREQPTCARASGGRPRQGCRQARGPRRGPVTWLRDLLERHATDDIVRAIDVRLRVFDAGRVLMTRESS